MEGSLVITLILKNLPLVLKKFTALTGLLVYSLTICINQGVKILYSLELLFQLLVVVDWLVIPCI